MQPTVQGGYQISTQDKHSKHYDKSEELTIDATLYEKYPMKEEAVNIELS